MTEASCKHCQAHLVDLLYGELGPDTAAEVREHLAGCVDCASSYAQLQQTLEFVDRLPLESPAPEVDKAIMKAARKRAAQSGGGAIMRWLGAPRTAMAAAALLAVGLGVWSQRVNAPDVARPEAQPAAVAKAPAPGEAVAVADETDPGANAAMETLAAAPTGEKRARRAPPKGMAAQEEAASGEANAARGSLDDSYRVAEAEEADAFSRSGAVAGASTKKSLAEAAEDPTLLVSRADALADQGECKPATKLYERFLKEAPDHPRAQDARLRAGRCYRRLGNVSRSYYWLAEAVDGGGKVADIARPELEELRRFMRPPTAASAQARAKAEAEKADEAPSADQKAKSKTAPIKSTASPSKPDQPAATE